MPFTAQQTSHATACAFKWKARFFPLIKAVDEYGEDKTGRLQVKFCGYVEAIVISDS